MTTTPPKPGCLMIVMFWLLKKDMNRAKTGDPRPVCQAYFGKKGYLTCFFLCKLGPFILWKGPCGLVTMTPGSPSAWPSDKEARPKPGFSGCRQETGRPSDHSCYRLPNGTVARGPSQLFLTAIVFFWSPLKITCLVSEWPSAKERVARPAWLEAISSPVPYVG